MEQKQPLQQMVLGDLDSHLQKNEIQSPTYTIHKNKFCPALPTPLIEEAIFTLFYTFASFVKY